MQRQQIATQRKALGLSQAALGRQVGLTGPEVSRLELGYRDLAPELAARLAAVLGLATPPAVAAPASTNGAARSAAVAPAPAVVAAPRGLALATAAVAQSASTVRAAPVMATPAKPAPAPVAIAAPTAPAAPSAPAPSVVRSATPASYSGAPDLSDPPRFCELPDERVLVVASEADVARLRRAIAYATRVLHTSRVPAATWRAWRTFEQAALDALRTVSVARPAES